MFSVEEGGESPKKKKEMKCSVTEMFFFIILFFYLDIVGGNFTRLNLQVNLLDRLELEIIVVVDI